MNKDLFIIFLLFVFIYNFYENNKLKLELKYLRVINKYTPLNNYNKVFKNLYIGNSVNILNENFINKHNIKLIINCSQRLPFIKKKNICKYRIPVKDDLSSRTNLILFKNLDKTGYLINLYLKNNKGVYVHCVAGMQRSATIIAGYLMKYKNLSKEDAIKYLKRKRMQVFFPVVNYDSVLSIYEDKLSA